MKLAVFALSLAALVSCDKDPLAISCTEARVSAVSQLTVYLNSPVTLNFAANCAGEPELLWTTSDPSVVEILGESIPTVSTDVLIVGRKAGTAVVMARVNGRGGATASVTIKVSPGPPPVL